MERYYHFLEEDKFMRKQGVLAAMLTGVMLVLCGCGGMTTDEAKDYVKSALDAGYIFIKKRGKERLRDKS